MSGLGAANTMYHKDNKLYSMVEYTVFFPVLSTLTWDTLLTLRSTWGFYLNHLIPIRPFKNVFDIVLLVHGGLPHVLPFAVHLIFFT